VTDSFYAGGGIGLGPRPEPAAREVYPVPEISSRDRAAGPDKRAVRDMVHLAEAYGWAVEVTYAKGCFPHAGTGRPGVPKESLAVRMERGRDFAVAVYVSGAAWSWDTLSILRRGRIERYPAVGVMLDALFGPLHEVELWPWAKCPVHRTAAWHPPYVRSW
jgi:hypothetical protein